MKVIKNVYFKVGGHISGITPKSSYKDTLFLDCTFHPDCEDIPFKDCIFVNCNNAGRLENCERCVIRT